MATLGRPRGSSNPQADADLLEAVDMLREDYGSCSLGLLAKHLGISRMSVRDKVRRLERDGFLVTSSQPGSIRRTP